MSDIQVADPLPGTLIDGRYRVRERLAGDQLTTSYLAVDERLERTVALKTIQPAQATEPGFVSRFIEETRSVARLTHPNVVATYDQGRYRHLPYLVTEYVRGRPLREVLRARTRLAPAEALAVAEQLFAALTAAHRAGLVHRDVKPENILVTEGPDGDTDQLLDRVVKVTDFGLTRAMETSGATAEHTGFLSTVGYVAPELVRTGRTDSRGDVYSAGIVLFEMLTGRLPFEGGRPDEVAWRHVDEEVPPPTRYVPDLPPALNELVVRVTRREAADRPPDAGAVLQDVRLLREQLPVAAPATPVSPGTASPPAPGSPAGAPPAGPDATVVLSPVPADEERPAWARLPAARPQSAGRRRAVGGDTGAQPPVGGAPPTGRWPTPNRSTMMIAAVVVLALLVGLGGWWFGFGRYQPAPDLVGLPEAEAVELARQRGLSVEFTDSRHDRQVAAGHVLAQDPEGRVARGGTVTLTLSLGPEEQPVPDLVGAELDVARRQLAAMGVTVTEAEPEYSDTVPAGRVLAVEPAPGEMVGPGDRVTVTASRGRAPITVPSLVGSQQEQASARLRQLGLVPVVEEVEHDAPAGQVIAQDPGAGSGVEAGAEVKLQVSNGPAPQPVPDVTGRECDEASRILTEAGFEVNQFGGGKVQIQNPGPGKTLPPGTRIDIVCFG